MNDTHPPAGLTPVLAIGRFRLTGWRATVAMAALGALLGWLIASRFPGTLSASGRWATIKTDWPYYTSVALWLVFSMYWGIAAKNASVAKSSESGKSRQFHVLLLNGSLLLLLIPVWGLQTRFLPVTPILPPIGLAIQAAFLCLAVWARRRLGRHWSGEVTVKIDHQLVRTGPYRIIRHPIYTAMIGMYIGTAIISGQIHALIAIAIVVAAYWRKIGLEEDALRGVFSIEYDEYRRRSWAVIPPIW
jgi:protein-S-isoprenylcysteine O-methyltransferase Ste14